MGTAPVTTDPTDDHSSTDTLLRGILTRLELAVIGKVGIDSANNTVRIGNRIIIPKTFVQAASYAATNNMGGLLTFDLSLALGLNMAGKTVGIRKMVLSVSASGAVTAAGAVAPVFFGSMPAGTFTDAAPVTPNASDTALIDFHSALTLTTTAFAKAAVATAITAQDAGIVLDGNGRCYCALEATAAHTYDTPTGANFKVEFVYWP